MAEKKMYYSDYLKLDELLHAQEPESDKPGNTPAHDEMLFIIVHQAYELWFKQIIYELDYVLKVFGKQKIDDNSEDLNLVRHRLKRVIQILELLNRQVSLIETMTPLDFLEFRHLLAPSSGFQSLQFRIVETKLGLKMGDRYKKEYYTRTGDGGLTKEDAIYLQKTESEKSLSELLNSWLERMPFFDKTYWKDFKTDQEDKDYTNPFWNTYRKLYADGLNEAEQDKLLYFDKLLNNKEANPDNTTFSATALEAALFIMLYRDFPVFQTSYQILDSLIEIDHLMAGWRHKHMVMVRRMIGMRQGTGNTSGAGYLQGALESHFVFKDLEGLSTFLIERKKLPKLPRELINKLSYVG